MTAEQIERLLTLLGEIRDQHVATLQYVKERDARTETQRVEELAELTARVFVVQAAEQAKRATPKKKTKPAKKKMTKLKKAA